MGSLTGIEPVRLWSLAVRICEIDIQIQTGARFMANMEVIIILSSKSFLSEILRFLFSFVTSNLVTLYVDKLRQFKRTSTSMTFVYLGSSKCSHNSKASSSTMTS